MPRPEPALFAAIERSNDHVLDRQTGARDEADEIVRVAVARVKRVEPGAFVERFERAAGDRREPALAVGEMREARGSSRELGEDAPEKEPVRRHRSADVGVRETISLRIVGATARHREGDAREIVRRHLTVACHDDCDVGVELERLLVPRRDRCADASVLGVANDDGVGPRFDRRGGGAIAARIVDHDHDICERRDAANGGRDPKLFVERGHDDRDALALEHPCDL
jgi:hypothetical protein